LKLVAILKGIGRFILESVKTQRGRFVCCREARRNLQVKDTLLVTEEANGSRERDGSLQLHLPTSTHFKEEETTKESERERVESEIY